LVIQKSGERVEPLLPELAIAGEPLRRLLHGFGRQRAADDPTLLFASDQPRVLENAQVLHEAGQRHWKRLRKLGYGPAAVGKPFHDFAARRIRERREDCVERLLFILNHKV